jgi:3-mercaptopyruvate sulfurtransferase SseA
MAAEDGVRGKLVDVHWLEKNLQSPDLLILDASPETYAKNHIPGAISTNIYDLFNYSFGGKSDEKLNQIFQSWGISPEKKIVIYDAGADALATTLFFDLDYRGFPEQNLFVLDGGLYKWQKEGLTVTSQATPPPKNGTFKIGKLNETINAELPEVLTASGDPANNALLEGLEPTWHFGAIAPFERGGHIPNSIDAQDADFYNPDKTFKSPEEIKRMLTYLGVRPEERIYTYCGGGVAATVPFFAAKFIVDYPKVKVFPQSELGWLSDERHLPYWTFDAPFLMRDSGWLQFWSGPMIHSVLSVPVSEIDVRSASAFNDGHIPFSLNVPGELFRSNLANPARLAEILGPAGVDQSNEAVVISGAGITKDSALAFLMLEKLGQKKVSIYIDSIAKWTQLKYPVVKTATVVGAKKGPRGISIPPTAYPEAFEKGIVITDPNNITGLYPKVYIASGKDLPSKIQNEKVVHVPYAELLNSDGTPKAAKDIWSILEKAGVPRYAELVCVSDDPGEAAVNYFILKLMGFPDIKVLV